jgi:hypothetical protein
MSHAPVPEFLLLGRPMCDLCEDLAAQLDTLRPALRFGYRFVDVDSTAELANRYGPRVPVLLDGDVEICTGPIATPALEAALRSHGL